MLPTTSEHPPHKHRSSLIWLAALPMLAILLVAPFLFLALYDGPAPDDSLLTPRLPLSQIAPLDPPHLADFLNAAADLRWTSIPHFDPNAPSVDAEELQLQGTHQDLLAKFDTLLAAPPDSWVWPASRLRSEFQASVPSPRAVRAVVELQLLRAHSEVQAKNIQSGVRRCLTLVRFTHKLRGNSASYYDLLRSLEIQTEVMKSLQSIVSQPNTPYALVQETLGTLQALNSPTREELILGIQLTYQEFKGLINDPDAQHRTIEGLYGRAPERPLKVKVNQSLKLWQEDTAPVVAALAQSWRDGLNAATQLPPSTEDASWWERVHAHLTWNVDGRLFHQISTIAPGTTPQNVMEHDRLRNMTLLMLAIRVHELRHGSLPNQLDELVPGVLPFQPIDIFTSLPFHWDPSAKMLRCQGTGPLQDQPYWWRNTIRTER